MLDRFLVMRENGFYPRSNRKELALENCTGMVYFVRETEDRLGLLEEEIPDHIRGNDFLERKIESCVAIVPWRRGEDQLVEFRPLAVRIVIPNKFAGERAVLVTQHCYVRMLSGWVREEVRGGGVSWAIAVFIRRRERDEEGS